MSGLAGISVLLTRPLADTEDLATTIESRGGIALRAPMIEIEPISPEAQRWPAPEADFTATVFTSKRAVEFGFAAWSRRLASKPAHTVCAVGPGTAAALAEVGVTSVVVPASAFNSEGLLALEVLAAEQVRGRTIVIIKGRGGRDVLTQALRARGAEVGEVECYVRRQAAVSIESLMARASVAQVDFAVVTSTESLNYLVKALHQAGLRPIFDAQLIVPGRRIAQAVRAAGFSRDPLVVDNPANDSIIECLMNKAGTTS